MKIAIAGYGLEGRASCRYWNQPGNDLTIVDERESVEGLPDGVKVELGHDAFSRLADFDLIIRSPSIHPKKLSYDGKVWSATNEFFAKCPAPIIGVTGTKGKGTTSSLIVSILKAAGKTVHLVGNIGTPAIAELPKIQSEDIVVFELSSFQLWDLQRSPHVAVVLGIEPDHLDVHTDMDDYVAAKANIVIHQSSDDLVVFNQNNDIAREIAEKSQAQRIAYPFAMTDFADALVIPGEHNVENASAAIAATSEYVTDQNVIRKGLSDFKGLPHRIKFVREVGGVKFYDDSYSSAPSASLAALKSFQAPRIILLGGVDRSVDFSELATYIATDRSIQVVAYGVTKERIGAVLRAQKIDEDRLHILETTDFSEIVHAAASLAQPGSVVLLSPGCASFDMFRNFTDRGEQFIRIVEGL